MQQAQKQSVSRGLNTCKSLKCLQGWIGKAGFEGGLLHENFAKYLEHRRFAVHQRLQGQHSPRHQFGGAPGKPNLTCRIWFRLSFEQAASLASGRVERDALAFED